MSRERIKLNDKTTIDLQKLIDSRLLVQANSGGGKSWVIRRILEQSHGKVQQIVIDPEGEFSTLREKYDYVLAGKNGDTPATPRSAAMLARKLLELNVSAIIDIYELPHSERKRFVRLFLDAMVNAPKNLWHPALVVLDEAHKFAPEKEKSEALEAVTDMATRGRKRGYCLIPATQRLSKLSKDVAAECNNKLIGRAGMDVDMKRAAEELGFTSKEQYLSLRSLDPGEFYAFGPAISVEVIKTKVGNVQTTHPKAGSRVLTKTTPPTSKIKNMLGKLADLPQEAEEEAKTMTELKSQLTNTKRELRQALSGQKVDEGAIQKAVKVAVMQKEREYDKERSGYIRNMGNAIKIINAVSGLVNPFLEKEKLLAQPVKQVERIVRPKVETPPPPPRGIQPDQVIFDEAADDGLGVMNKGERKILIAIAGDPEGITRNHVTVLTGYKTTSRNEYVRRLKLRGYIEVHNDRIMATEEGIEALGNDYEQLPTGQELQEHLMRTLPTGEKKILEVLVDHYPGTVSREEISEHTNYKTTSRNEYLRRLTARRLVEVENGEIKAADNLFT